MRVEASGAGRGEFRRPMRACQTPWGASTWFPEDISYGANAQARQRLKIHGADRSRNAGPTVGSFLGVSSKVEGACKKLENGSS